MNYAKLSKEISCALRRHPEYYGLEPDRAGFVGIDDLIRGINHSHPDAMPVTRNHIEEALAHSSKQRHEFYQDKIRALYGMSFRGRRTLAPRVPPKVLYHGTTPRVLDAIMREGLRPMDRRMVYLSEDFGRKYGRRMRQQRRVLSGNEPRVALQLRVACISAANQLGLGSSHHRSLLPPYHYEPLAMMNAA